jgi:hypothetical protein
MEYMTLVQPWELGLAETDSIWACQRCTGVDTGRELGGVVAAPRPKKLIPSVALSRSRCCVGPRHDPESTHDEQPVGVLGADGIVHGNLEDIAGAASHLVHDVVPGDGGLADKVLGDHAPELCCLGALGVACGAGLTEAVLVWFKD